MLRVAQADDNRDRLHSALLMHHHTLEVDLKDVIVWNETLGQRVQSTPGEMLPLVRIMLVLEGAVCYRSLTADGICLVAPRETNGQSHQHQCREW